MSVCKPEASKSKQGWTKGEWGRPHPSSAFLSPAPRKTPRSNMLMRHIMIVCLFRNQLNRHVQGRSGINQFYFRTSSASWNTVCLDIQKESSFIWTERGPVEIATMIALCYSLEISLCRITGWETFSPLAFAWLNLSRCHAVTGDMAVALISEMLHQNS